MCVVWGQPRAAASTTTTLRVRRGRTLCASRCVCVCVCLSECVYVRGVGSAASSRFNDYDDFARAQREDGVRIKVRVCACA
jgi:tetrahydromethanopterin S-methyltransferase subunit D